MKKFSKFIACLSAFAMCISMLDFSGSISAYSANYTGNGFSEAQIAESLVKPNIKIDNEYLLGTAWGPGEGTVYIDITLSGENVDNNYCNTGLYITCPPDNVYNSYSLEILDVKAGKAIESLSYEVSYITDNNGTKNTVYLKTEGDSNAGKTGVMYTLICKTPYYVRGGEQFPINIDIEDGKSYFTNYENDKTGKLMQDYLFTKGIKNGTVTSGYMTTTTVTYTNTTYYTTTTTTTVTYPQPDPNTTYYTTTPTSVRTTDMTTTSTTTTEEPVQTTTTTNTTAPVVTGTGYENWTMFEDTIVSIENNKVTFAERGKTSVMNNGSNMDMIKDAGVGSKVSVEAIVSPSGSILNIINIEVLEKPDVPTGDANSDGKLSVADAVLIMQALANPEEFSITKECAEAADVVNKGDGITSMDALAIQMIDINLLSIEDLPITSEELQEIME
ncbi:MAG: dockerin type I repeat-containing protein [Prevotella sp.]|nr:dockerin type I repeat-containing protein [Alistipes senegalensis]MCM1357316.1 dockerin type I repeat-containing protein [Prevotella sp.]MCM1472759.1 dockerin type I repeat-containing protein [Muribaculaceae bacterium]